MTASPSQRFAMRAGSPTSLLIGINVAAYVAMVAVGGKSDILGISDGTLVLFGANYAPLVREGQVQRLLASAFLHLNPLHLLLNVAALVALGPIVERDYGRLRFVVLYLAAGIVGSIASVAWNWRHPVISAGASGAICGVIAAGAVRAHFDGPSRASERRTLVSWAVATLGFGAVIGADNAAHVGGLAAGGLFGLIYRKRHAPSVERSTLPSAIAVISVMLAFGATIRARGHAETAASLVNRGVDLARADDHDAAIAAYRRALVLEPNDAIAHYDLGLSLEEIGDYAGGIEHLTRAYEIAPSTERRDALVSAHLHRAHALFESGDKSGAIDGYRKAVSVDPNNARAHSELGLALLGNDELDAAISELRAALKIQPDVDTTKGALASALTKQGLALAKQGKRAEAIAHFREAITLDDESWESHYGLGLALVEERDPSGAVSELQKAFELEPSETVRTALADAIEARGDARADAGALGAALDDMGSATVLRLAPLDAGTPPRSPR